MKSELQIILSQLNQLSNQDFFQLVRNFERKQVDRVNPPKRKISPYQQQQESPLLVQQCKINQFIKPTIRSKTPQLKLFRDLSSTSTQDETQLHMNKQQEQLYYVNQQKKRNYIDLQTPKMSNDQLSIKATDYQQRRPISAMMRQKNPNLSQKKKSSTTPMRRPSSALQKSISIQRTQGPPKISAQSFAIFNVETESLHCSYIENKRSSIASLTKIMTCWVSFQLAYKYNLNLEKSFFLISNEVDFIDGTSAHLEPEFKISLLDLLYGLMLPSGNDAAVVLAENFSHLLREKSLPTDIRLFQRRTSLFIHEMNLWAKRLQLHNTVFYNPHGLSNDSSYSTAYDIGLLCCTVIRDANIQKIINTPLYLGKMYSPFVKKKKFIYLKGKVKRKRWINTNKLLGEEGFYGIKTGITSVAGPCLASWYKKDEKNIIIILLNCDSVDSRWKETKELATWVNV